MAHLQEHSPGRIADALSAAGWLVLPDWLAAHEQTGLLQTACAHAATGELQAARVGRSNELRRDTGIRGDSIQWLAPDDPCAAVGGLLGRLNELRTALNARLYLGLVEIEAHFRTIRPAPATSATSTVSAATMRARFRQSCTWALRGAPSMAANCATSSRMATARPASTSLRRPDNWCCS